MDQSDTVAMMLNKERAIQALNGECLRPSELLPMDPTTDTSGNVVLIVKHTKYQPSTAVEFRQQLANAIVLALDVIPSSHIIEEDAAIPEGFDHHSFIEPDFRHLKRRRRVVETIDPITFCEEENEPSR